MTANPEPQYAAPLDPDLRALPGEIARQHKMVSDNLSIALFEGMPLLVFVLNETRQIVWQNSMVTKTLAGASGIGRRMGEALGCNNAAETPAGCGGSGLCGFCGAPKAFLEALRKDEDIEEWVIQRDERFRFEALDLLVWSKSIAVQGERFVILTARDESQKKRHELLERIFYHDIGNTINGIRSLMTLMELGDGDPNREYMELMDAATEQLVDEIQSHKALQDAESGELEPRFSTVSMRGLIREILKNFAYALYGKNIDMAEDGDSPDLSIRTDPVLLRRVIINMLKNAMEASVSGETVRIGFKPVAGGVGIRVQNPSVLGPESRLRIFQRAYTTKGRGRGYGTYSMKLLCERYLGGRVSFSSEEGSGTEFVIEIPDQDLGGREAAK